jgi:hypothetical protein
VNEPDGIYDFAFRGLMAEQALDAEGRARAALPYLDEEVAATVSLSLLDEGFVAQARRMATVYTAIAAFENTVRDLVRRVLLDDKGADWWEKGVSNSVKTKATRRQEEEAKHRFHTQRGEDPVSFIDFADLLNVMRANEEAFAPFWPSPEWAKSVFDALERSRNVIMHSGMLDPEDIERVGMMIRDWVRQVGA